MKVGDVVNVHFSRAVSLFRVRITHCPCAEGDSWEMEDKFGFKHRVMMFECMDEIGEEAELEKE